MGDFVFTQPLVNVSKQLWLYSSVASAGLCFLVSSVIFVLALDRPSRRYLDRVSFRIVCLSLAANTVYAIASAVGGAFEGPTPACGLAIWIVQLTLQLSSLLNFCIALNMQMVIVHGIDGRRAEKYYILGSILLSLLITIPPYAAKQYGWDEQEQSCWYASNNKNARIAWQIGTQILWTGAAVMGEVVSCIFLIAFLWRHTIWRKRIVRSINARTWPAGLVKGQSEPNSIHRQIDNVKAYKGIIIRIALYPIVSCMINLTSIATMLHTSIKNGVHSRTDYNILLLSMFLYGGRGMVYAILAASDPALIRAAKSFIKRSMRTPSFIGPSFRTPQDSDATVIRVEMTTIRRTDFRGAEDMQPELAEDMPKVFDILDQKESVDCKSVPPVGARGDRDGFDEVPPLTGATEALDGGQSSLEMQGDVFGRQI